MKPVAILASGMVTGVGLTSAASCAAIRCAIDNFTETRFMDKSGEWIIGSQAPLERQWLGLTKLAKMAVSAIGECLAWNSALRCEEIPLLLCVAERERPGRLEGLDDRLLGDIEREMGIRFHRASRVIAAGRISGAHAVEEARRLIHAEGFAYCLIAAADSYLDARALAWYDARNRLLGSTSPNGFIPGEAGAAVLVGQVHRQDSAILCTGIGRGRESATLAVETPFRAEGMVQAFKNALADAQSGFEQLDYRISDANGEQYWFKEAALALTRTMRVRKPEFSIWHPVDCIGETGAAAGPCALGIALAAARKGYAPGNGVLCHFSSDGEDRAALVLRANEERSR